MSFVENGGATPPTDPPADFFAEPSSDEEPVKITLTASRRAIDRMAHLLHRQNIIAGSDWSRPIAIKNSTEVIRVASRMIRLD
jgi:hypothetical protein